MEEWAGAYTSHISRLYLAYTSPISRLYLPGVLSVEEWAEGFPALPESCPSSQQLLARLELPPSSAVREIREVDAAAAAGGRPALAARSLPRAALHHFKFKLQPPRGFALVWSSRC